MDDQLAERIQPLKVIILAMAGGMVAFAVVAAVVANGESFKPDEKAGPLLLGVLGLLAAGESVAYVVLRHVVLAKLKAQEHGGSSADPASRIGEGFSTLTIIGGAMAEGLGLFGVVIYLISGNAWGLAAAGGALLAVLAQFPTRARIRSFTSAVSGQMEL